MSRFDNNCLWITSGLDDRFARAVLEGVVGSDAEAFHTVRVGEAVVAEAALDLDAGAPHEGGEVRHPVALEGGDLVPGVIKRL